MYSGGRTIHINERDIVNMIRTWEGRRDDMTVTEFVQSYLNQHIPILLIESNPIIY